MEYSKHSIMVGIYNFVIMFFTIYYTLLTVYGSFPFIIPNNLFRKSNMPLTKYMWWLCFFYASHPGFHIVCIKQNFFHSVHNLSRGQSSVWCSVCILEQSANHWFNPDQSTRLSADQVIKDSADSKNSNIIFSCWEIFKRPGVAGAVVQTPLLLIL